MPEDVFDMARRLSQQHFGRRIDFFLPGMFIMDGRTGRYPAISLTGRDCGLQCEHCRGRLLETMIPANSPEALYAKALDLEKRGRLGMLISGGSDRSGRLPWEPFLPVIEKIVRHTNLTVTVHAGYLDAAAALNLKAAGVKQALVDIMGDDGTARNVYHLKRGTAPVWETMDALTSAGLDTAPHIVLGLDFGKITGEYAAVERLAGYHPARLVTVVITPMSGTAIKNVTPPTPLEAAEFLAFARETLPAARHHLGCARPRGRYRHELDRLAVRAGINALALPSDEARDEAVRLGLDIACFDTCCSLAGTNL